MWKKLIIACCVVTTLSASGQDQRKAFVDSLLNGVEIRKDIRYNTTGRPLLLDIYYPEQKNRKLLPCVVWIHGGALTDESIRKDYDLIRWGVARTVKKGYINVSVDYRLITESPLPTAIQDCMTAIRFLKCHAEEYGIDTTRMAVVGESAGGFLAGFCSFTCNTNIFTTNEWRGASNQLTCGVLWYPAISHSPYHMTDYISPDDIPVISIHGDGDSVVPIGQSYTIQRKCGEKRTDFKLYAIKGSEHGFFDSHWTFNEMNRRYMEESIEITIRFLDRHFK